MRLPKKYHDFATFNPMINLLAFLPGLFFALPIFATTWDEPWADKVIKEADHFVLAEVRSSHEEKGVTIEIIKVLAGKELKGKIKISSFYLVDICSSSGGHGPEFHFEKIDECYFFIKKKEGKYCIATPTTGFDKVEDGNVIANYRHSYHQALVPAEVYERTMTAIFNHYHGEPYDKTFITEHVNKYLSLAPAGFEKSEINTFFLQHVALECVFHLRLPGYDEKVLTFLRDTSNFHNQVSAARALIASNSENARKELVNVISDTSRSNFVQVMCIWSLQEHKPKELKEQLLKMKDTASEESNGFGGNIMDPRVCTSIPNVKEALETLIKEL